MGWYEVGRGIKESIETLKEDTGSSKCLKACFRGSPLNGVLWQVRESRDGLRYIRCDKIEFRSKSRTFFNKPMCEGDGPYYYSCPLSYLAICPVVNAEWRQLVVERKRCKV